MESRPELHKRQKSGLSTLLRRSKTHDDNDNESGSESGSLQRSLTSQSTNAATPFGAMPPPSISNSPQDISRMSNMSSTNMSANTTSPTPAAKNGKLFVPVPEKTVSMEQSVKKFRIFEALRNGDTVAISKAIKESADGPRRSTSSAATTSGGGLEDTTILHLAIQCADTPVVEYVLSEGAGTIDINAKDREGNTPLHVAAQQGRGHIVRLLLEQDGINDSITNYQGRSPLDLARTPDISQQLTLCRSIFVDTKTKEIQNLIASGDYKLLGEVLEEPRVKTLLDVNGGDLPSDITTVQSGGTLLHEAARKKNIKLIQVLLFHGADPFRRDRRGKLPQDVTKDETTRSMLKRSPAAIAAQRGIQEKAVLGNMNSQDTIASAQGDTVAGKDSREMSGYLKKWTNYRKGYQLRWFVLTDGILSYYKHQDDAGAACRGAINMKIAKLNMDPSEKTKFEILGKSSVKYALRANHEVEAKRWFWALNNSIQWTKDQAREEEKTKARNAEMLAHAKAEHSRGASNATLTADLTVDPTDTRRSSMQSSRLPQIPSQVNISKSSAPKVAFAAASAGGSVADEEEVTNFGSYEPSYMGDNFRHTGQDGALPGEDEDDYQDETSSRDEPASKDAFDITAQSARLQLEMMATVNAALQQEQTRSPATTITDSVVIQAINTNDGSIRSLRGLVGDLLKISRDRDAYWQHRLDREADMRRLWEDSMAKVAREQEVLEARVGESEEKRKKTKRALREAIENNSRPQSRESLVEPKFDTLNEVIEALPETASLGRRSTAGSSLRRKSILAEMTNISDDSESDDEEFFDAVDAGQVEVAPIRAPVPTPVAKVEDEKKGKVVTLAGADPLSSSWHGYEDGIRKKLAMDADDRPKISLWSILKSMIGKDMTKMTLPVSFNEPTSLLQRCAEDMEYADLLDLAASRPDSTERLVYVSAFAASEYASTIGRVAKPFNPLLGETYEYARPDKKYRFFIEQVSHHPPIGAAYAEAPRWTYYGESAVKSKFYGKSFDINPLGTWFLWLRPSNGDKEELYTWKKVTSSVIGIITGSPTVDNYGTMEIKNWMTGEVAIIDFKPRGWTASSAYQITGRVNDKTGNPRFSMGGRWNNKIYARLTPGYEAAIEEPKKGQMHRRDSIVRPDQAFLVWEANARPTGIPFNLTPFVLTLNAIPETLKPWLPPTDTRLRPDQRAMEDGKYDFAATEKNRVEEKQRATRRAREGRGEEFVPRWFGRAKCPVTGEAYWEYKKGDDGAGDYWSERERVGSGKGSWEGVEDIF